MNLRTIGTKHVLPAALLLAALVISPPATAQETSSDTAEVRVAEVAAVLVSTANTLDALSETAENATDCADLASRLNEWADTYGSRLEDLLISGYALGLLPDEIFMPDIVEADGLYLVSFERWASLEILQQCEASEDLQANLSEDFEMVFGMFRSGAEEFALLEEELAPIPVFAELVECMGALKSTVESGGSCGQMIRRMNAWWDNFGEQYEAARDAAFATEFLEHDEDTSLAELQAFGGLVDRYNELLEWMDGPFMECVEDPDDTATLVTVLADGLDLPPATDDWGRPEDTYEYRKETYKGNPFGRDAFDTGKSD